MARLAGTHRVQRVPDGSNRRHSSTVTVAVVQVGAAHGGVSEADVEARTYRGGGPGGQHRNTSDTGVELTHVPTGIVAKSDRERSWYQNRRAAWAELERRVGEAARVEALEAVNSERRRQVGAGDRVSHDWTWCAWRNEVTDHATGDSWPMDRALRGRIRL